MSLPASTEPGREDDGLKRSARLMQALGARGGPIWSQLTPEEADSLSTAMQSLPPAAPEEGEAIAQAFLHDGATPAQVPSRPAAKEGLSFVADQIPPEIMIRFMLEEHPQTAAFLLSRLSPERAARLLKELPAGIAPDILRRMLNMRAIHPSTPHVISAWLAEKRLQGAGEGHERIARIFDRLSAGEEAALFEALDAAAPGASEKVRALMFGFDDLAKLPAAGVQTLIAAADRGTLALALKGATAKTAHAFFANMTSRAGDFMRDEIDAMGPVRRAEVDAARADLVELARALLQSGEIGGSGDIEDELVE